MERTSKEIVNKETEDLNDSVDQIDLLDKYRTFHLVTTEYILLKHIQIFF